MEELFKPIFLVVRLPFFLLGIFLYTFIVPLRLVFALLVVPALGIPGAFLKGAFSNNTRLFAESLKDMTDFIGEFVGDTFSSYGSMFFWLLGVKHADKKTKQSVGVVLFFISVVCSCLFFAWLPNR